MVLPQAKRSGSVVYMQNMSEVDWPRMKGKMAGCCSRLQEFRSASGVFRLPFTKIAYKQQQQYSVKGFFLLNKINNNYESVLSTWPGSHWDQILLMFPTEAHLIMWLIPTMDMWYPFYWNTTPFFVLVKLSSEKAMPQRKKIAPHSVLSHDVMGRVRLPGTENNKSTTKQSQCWQNYRVHRLYSFSHATSCSIAIFGGLTTLFQIEISQQLIMKFG